MRAAETQVLLAVQLYGSGNVALKEDALFT